MSKPKNADLGAFLLGAFFVGCIIYGLVRCSQPKEESVDLQRARVKREHNHLVNVWLEAKLAPLIRECREKGWEFRESGASSEVEGEFPPDTVKLITINGEWRMLLYPDEFAEEWPNPHSDRGLYK